MATAIQPLNRLHVGIEATKGTIIPATRLIECDAKLIEEIEFYRSNYPSGFRSNTGGAGTITRKGTRYEIPMDASPEDILPFLLSGVRGGVTAIGAGADKTWTFEPQLTTGVPTLDTLTVEGLRTDGVTNHYYGESGYGLTESISLEWTVNGPVTCTVVVVGRAAQTGAPTASLVQYTGREILSSNQLGVYVDSTWAGLGTTQLLGTTKSVKYEFMSGFRGGYTLDQRTDRDFYDHEVGRATAKLSTTMELDATAAARLAERRANSLTFWRLKSIGGAIGATTKMIQIDGCYRWTGFDGNGVENDQNLVTAELESVLDTTSSKSILWTVINGLTSAN